MKKTRIFSAMLAISMILSSMVMAIPAQAKAKAAKPKVTVKVSSSKIDIGKGLKINTTWKKAPKKSKAKVQILNSKKKAIVNVKNWKTSKKANGKKSIKWNGKDKKGKAINEGTYYARFICGKTKKDVKFTINPLIKSIEVIGSKALRVTLSQKQTLTAQDFSVRLKEFHIGTYLADSKIDTVKTMDNIVYDIILENDYIYTGSYVKVEIKSFGSNKELCYLGDDQSQPEDIFISGYVGTSINEEIYLSDYTNGKITASIDYLPAGLTYTQSGKEIYIKGTPTNAENRTLSKITCKNELGKTVVINVYFCIGSSTTIVGYSRKTEKLPNQNFYIDANFIGGSNSYNFSLIGETYGLEIDDYGYSYCEIYGAIKNPGTYNITLRAIDRNNQNLKTDLVITITILNTVDVTGTITDAEGNPIGDAYVHFSASDSNKNYSYSVRTDSMGKYTAKVPAEDYNITAYAHNASESIYKISIGQGGRTGLDIKINVYKVTLTPNIAGAQLYEWYDENSGEYFDSNDNVLYLKPGTYMLTNNYIYLGNNNRYTAKITFTVVNKSLSLNVTLEKYIPQISGTLILNSPVNVAINGYSSNFWRFTPQTSGYYTIYSNMTDDNADPYAELYNENLSYIMENDDGGTGLNFSIRYYLEANKTYYVNLMNYSGTATFPVIVELDT